MRSLQVYGRPRQSTLDGPVRDTYLQRDIPQLGPRIPAETLRRFWTMLAHGQGTPFVTENVLRVAPERTEAYFYGTATKVEVDLVLQLPRGQRWAIEIKRGLATMDRALRVAFEDVRPDRAIVVHGREGRFPKGGGVEAMDLHTLLNDLKARA